MSKSDVAEMVAGRELDVLIAKKVMGWKREWWDDHFLEWNIPTTFAGVTAIRHVAGEQAMFSTDIAAAWEVVEKCRPAPPYVVCLYCDSGEWYCCFDSAASDHCGKWWGIANTAPLAICRAALKAVESK